jgi:hypothetical protein
MSPLGRQPGSTVAAAPVGHGYGGCASRRLARITPRSLADLPALCELLTGDGVPDLVVAEICDLLQS